jgi:hypothetical protein
MNNPLEQKPNIEIALKLFESARAELVSRIGLRDQVLMLFVAASGAIFTIALVPMLSMGAALLVAQHNGMIGAIRSYCATEFQLALDSQNFSMPQWDNSYALGQFRQSGVSHRSWGHIIVLVVPAFIGLAVNYKHAIYSSFPFGPLWWGGLVSTFLVAYVLVKSHLWRSSSFDQYQAWAGKPPRSSGGVNRPGFRGGPLG